MHTEILGEIREAEERARGIERESQEKRRDVIARAREEADQAAEAGREAAEEESRKLAAQRTAQAQGEAQGISHEGEARVDQIRQAAGARVEEAVERALKKLLG